MSYDRYPHTYEEDLDKQLNSTLQQQRAELTKKIESTLQKEFENRFGRKIPYTQIDSTAPDCFGVIPFMTIVGVVGGFIASAPAMTIRGGLSIWGAGIVLGFVLGVLLRAARLSAHDGKVRRFKEFTAKVKAEEDEFQKYADNLRAENKRECQKYLEDFNRAVMQTSVDFAGSELTQKVADDLYKVYATRINHADRRGHIMRIDVDFSFTVTNTEISNSVSNVLSFEVARFRRLRGPVEQAALANAIASAMELRLAMEMSTDISGTVPQVNVERFYGRNYVRGVAQDFAKIQFTYTAPNGGYQAVRDWK